MESIRSRLFTHESFQKLIIDAEERGYEFQRFDDNKDSSRKFYLRHDVDISPPDARVLGRLSSELGIRANFFFLIDGETYNVFSTSCISTIKELRSLGHCVGLHIDQDTVGDDELAIKRTLDWFSETVTPIDNVVSFHRPGDIVLNRNYGSFVNAYAPRFFSLAKYYSDSRFSHAFYEPLVESLRLGTDDVQLLLHPVWWAGEQDVRSLLRAIRRRRAHELDGYMKRCFNHVFGDHTHEAW